jgi:hypothetical protein
LNTWNFRVRHSTPPKGKICRLIFRF